MADFVGKCAGFCDFMWNGISKKYDRGDRQAERRYQNRTGEIKKRACSSGTLWKITIITAVATTALLIARPLVGCYSDKNSLTCVQLEQLVQASFILQFSAIGILVYRQ